MNKICTSIEQSQKLIELRIDISTADMDYIQFANDPKVYDCVINIYNNEHEDDWIPAWSLSALLDILPNKQGRGTKSLYWFDDGWHCDYIDEDGASVCGLSADSPIDAAFEMACWLKENKKI